MEYDIPLFEIYWDEQDVEKVSEAIRRGMDWAVGPDVRKFEGRLAQYVGRNYAVAFNSGTSAMHAILLACGIGEGDEVIVPSFTFISTANCALFVGAKPVFAEVEEVTYGLDPVDVERKITSKTKAIFPVHYGGSPCLIEELRQVAQEHNLLLIEDAAEALGARVNDKKAGSFGDAAVLSFCQNKVITTGEGGAIATNSKELYDKLKLICSHGRSEDANWFYSTEPVDYVALGYNFRMSNITAALGISQLEKIDKLINMRRDNALYMSQRLSQLDGVITPTIPDGFYHIYQMYTIRLKGKGNLRDNLMKYLYRQGIMSKIYFHPVHLTTFYRRSFGYCEGSLPLTEEIASEVLTLPMYPSLNKEKIDYVVQQIEDFLMSNTN